MFLLPISICYEYIFLFNNIRFYRKAATFANVNLWIVMIYSVIFLAFPFTLSLSQTVCYQKSSLPNMLASRKGSLNKDADWTMWSLLHCVHFVGSAGYFQNWMHLGGKACRVRPATRARGILWLSKKKKKSWLVSLTGSWPSSRCKFNILKR